MKREAVVAFWLGLVLFGASAWPLFLIAREEYTGAAVASRYAVDKVFTKEPGFAAYTLSDRLGSTDVRLEDGFKSTKPEDRVEAPVRILIASKDYSSPENVVIRPYYKDSNRYHGWAHMTRVADKRTGARYIVVTQFIPARKLPFAKENQRWRQLWVSEDGSVREDVFMYDERGRPPIRAHLIEWATGYYSEILQSWPTLLFPILFPLITGPVGLILLLWAAARRGAAAAV